MSEALCAHHVNGFRHLTTDLSGLEYEYDLGFRFEERESDKFVVDPNTGVKAWAEPLLVLYISVAHRGLPALLTLHYGLTRSKFARGVTSTHEDQQRLLEMARPHIESDLLIIRAGRTPYATRDVVML